MLDKAQRKEQLLQLACRSRAKWINDACRGDLFSPPPSAARSPASSSTLPGALAVQSVLDLLADFAGNEEEPLNVEAFVSLLPVAGDDDDEEEAANTADGHAGTSGAAMGDAFGGFLAKLRRASSPQVLLLVRSLQHFCAKLLTEHRAAMYSGTGSSSLSSSNPHSPPDSYSSSAGSGATCWLASLAPQQRHAHASAAIHSFVAHCCDELRSAEPFKSEPPQAWRQTRWQLDKLLFIKMFGVLGPELEALESSSDTRLADRVRALHFLSPEHLDLPLSLFASSVSGGPAWALTLEPAAECIRRVRDARCPQDVVACVRGASKEVAKIAKSGGSSGSSGGGGGGGGGSSSGADRLLPLTILAVHRALTANSANGKSSTVRPLAALAFARIYLLQREPLPSGAEADSPREGDADDDERAPGTSAADMYLHTQMFSACQFLLDCDVERLSINPRELEDCMARSRSATDLTLTAASPPVRSDSTSSSNRGDDASRLQQSEQEAKRVEDLVRRTLRCSTTAEMSSLRSPHVRDVHRRRRDLEGKVKG